MSAEEQHAKQIVEDIEKLSDDCLLKEIIAELIEPIAMDAEYAPAGRAARALATVEMMLAGKCMIESTGNVSAVMLRILLRKIRGEMTETAERGRAPTNEEARLIIDLGIIEALKNSA